MWSRELAQSLGDRGPVVIAMNPGSFLGTKMVKQAFGVTGGDIRKGAEIPCRASLAEEYAAASGQNLDNDAGLFASPHPEALDTVGKVQPGLFVITLRLQESAASFR